MTRQGKRMIGFTLLAGTLAIACLACESAGTWTGDEADEALGFRLATAGDIDRDGAPDLLVASMKETVLISAATANVLFAWDFKPDTFCAAGDLDSDGTPDILFSFQHSDPEGSTAEAIVCSGRTGQPIRSWIKSSSGSRATAAGLGDVNGDSVPDVAMGTASSPGQVWVFSGGTGELLWERGNLFGHYTLANAGDVDRDGISDLAMNAVGNDGKGVVYVHSGRTGAHLRTYKTLNASAQFGWAIAGAGDVDRDGVADLIVGDETAGLKGEAHLFSGRTGASIRSWLGEGYADRFGVSVSAAGDLDADGFPDILVGASEHSQEGKAYAFSGRNGRLIWSQKGEAKGDVFGYSLAGGLRLGGNDVFVVGAPLFDGAAGQDCGKIYGYQGPCWAPRTTR